MTPAPQIGDSRAGRTQAGYDRYYARSGADRNDLRTNPGVLFQTLALEASVVRAVRAMRLDPPAARVLDVGCGSGGDLFHLLRLGFDPANVTGIDIREQGIARARRLYPQIRFVVGDASAMDFADGSFDLVWESTMFVTLADPKLSAQIAREMVRVCTPEGYLLLVDWRTPKPWAPEYRALRRSRMRYMFDVGGGTRLVGTFRGALVPPVGRLLSKWLPSMYFLLAACCPPLVGQVAYLLQKNPAPAADAPYEVFDGATGGGRP